jgi:hypothetical protein
MSINTWQNNEEPQERPDIRMVQSYLNSDGTRTLAKYDEKRTTNKYGILF